MPIETEKINRKKIVLFIFITFLMSYLLAGLLWLGKMQAGKLIFTLITVIYMFTPLAGVFIVMKLIYRERMFNNLQIRFVFNRWVWMALVIPTALAFVTFGVSLLLPGVEYSPDMAGMFSRFEGMLSPELINSMKEQVANLPFHPILLSLFQGLVAGITVNAIAGLGEEIGWRGFLHRELAPLGFWRRSWLTGFIWGVWHLPLILQGLNYPEHPRTGVLMMILWCILLSPIFSYIRMKANTVWATAVFHGSLNANYVIAIMLIKGGSDLTVGLTGMAGFITLALANVALFWVRKIQPTSTHNENVNQHG